jgi:16S rRNA G966 N2-methylase RsmD
MAKSSTCKKGDKYKAFILNEKTDTFGEPPNMDIPKWQNVIDEVKDNNNTPTGLYKKLQKYDATENKRSFAGNKIIYRYFTECLMKTRYKGGKTQQEVFEKDPKKVWERVCKMDRRKGFPPSPTDILELNRTITFFKPTIAKHLCVKFNATSVLDPCAGWGGRMLGSVSTGAKYTGYDTNKELEEPYNNMIKDLKLKNAKMIYNSCLEDVNFGGLKYDLVLTSPPYENLEIYEGMKPFENDDVFYDDFLIPMIDKCRKWINPQGKVCINISPKMYEKLTIKYMYPEAPDKINFLQQMGQKSGKKEDFIYIWNNNNPNISL